MTKHTEGPWEAGYNGNILGKKEGCSQPIVAVMPVWFPAYRGKAHVTQEHQEANARLITVAPELLAALKRAFKLIKESGFRSGLTEEEFDATLTQAGEAIAKAEGSE